MITIPISGIIANYELESESNVTPVTLKKSLEDANGEDILITINSPGGIVSQGLEMFSMIKNYPGNSETRVISMAASMGSILALAGQKKSIESTALFYIHNAQTYGGGDYREMLRLSKWAKDVSGLLAELYEENTTLSATQAQKLMDDETQFYGKDLESLGFIKVDTGEDVNMGTARVKAIARIEEIKNKISHEDALSDLEKVAASISGDKKYLDKINESQNVMSHVSNPASAGKNNKREVSNMTLEQLKTEHPDLYNQIFQAGAEKERKRVMAHIKLGKVSGLTDKMHGFIESGASTLDEDVAAEYQAASMNRTDVQNREGDDPEDVKTPEENTNALNDKVEAKMDEIHGEVK